MRTGYLFFSGLLALGVTFGIHSKERAMQRAAPPPTEGQLKADPSDYILTAFWIDAQATRRMSAPPKPGPPFPVLPEPEKTDLIALLQPINRGWKFRQVAALSLPFPKEGETLREAKVSTPDGEFSIKPMSLEVRKDGRVNIVYAESGLITRGDGSSSEKLISPGWEVGKTYSIAATGPADYTTQFSTFMCVTKTGKKQEASP